MNTTFSSDPKDLPRSLGALRQSPWGRAPLRGRSVRAELRHNLLRRLADGGPLFPGIIGYEDTIEPQIVNAILSRHHFILLGLRGQAKSRLLRSVAGFLDEWMPAVAGSEVNDDPFAPISKYARERLAECGDATAIDWVHRDNRYVEKLATPDVTIADLIGDLDPIKAARGGHLLSDELTMHFGLLPRANRGIFAINELPDLSSKVQVGLFNVMQEGDIQIKGYPVRLPLDVLLVFTANPEDYTARGKIITPLKDRVGSEIITHYPRTVELGMAITAQEAWTDRSTVEVDVPSFILELVERVAFEGREDARVDRKSGVSQRLPITVLENAVSGAERRAILASGKRAVPRVSDVHGAVSSITGKLELEYEGELQGAETVARELIRKAAGSLLDERADEISFDEIVQWFDGGGVLKFSPDEPADVCLAGFSRVEGLVEAAVAADLATRDDAERMVAACELILEGLAAWRRISRSDEMGWTRARRAG
ncbi:MAG TPA: sigma 54-interacting transcriptional regulator [Gemmatimonadales bacterium]|nr:sigma 54-interacting transcriptional regulator [Gemmatimonadales bacterium]